MGIVMQNNQLKSTLKTLYEFADEIEKNGNYTRIGRNSLKEYLRFDLLKFLLWLSSQGKLTYDELAFVNDVLGFKYTFSEFQNFYTSLKLETTFADRLPDSFAVFAAEDDKDSTSGSSVSVLLADFYRLLGICFISSDNDATESQIYKLTEFILSLKSRSAGGSAGIKMQQAAGGETQAGSDETEIKEPRPFEEIMDEMNELVGLTEVKTDVTSLVNLVRVRELRKERGLKQAAMSMHLVFSGNPGTGKTTVARLLAEVYHSIGLLSKGHLHETDRSGLVAGYVGQTALKVKEVVEKSMGGILFIDEAYALTNNTGPNDFGSEAIAALLKAMEDHRDDLIVIVAGYTELMEEFLSSNPGLRSRFNKFIFFPDYTADELMGILSVNCKKMNLKMTKKAVITAKEFFENRVVFKEENYANGRDVRNYFEKAIISQANRIADLKEVSDEALNTIIYADVRNIKL